MEVYYNRVWGTVCDDSWDINDAKVVCHQLGYGRAIKAYTSAAFGPGDGKIWMDDVRCTGRERSLAECSHNVWGKEDCDHSEDAGVSCSSNRLFLYSLIVFHELVKFGLRYFIALHTFKLCFQLTLRISTLAL